MRRILFSRCIVAVVCTLGWVVLLARFHGFVLDDAFITYRYAEHLASGEGLIWNLGEDPVEGYTSFLWVAANALAIICGIDPVVFSKLVSSLAALAIVWFLAHSCRKMDPSLGLILTGGVAFCPLFAFLVMQGMETALVALLLLVAARLGLRMVSNPSWTSSGWLCLVAFVACLARPDSVAFLGGLLGGLLALFVVRCDFPATFRLGLTALAACVPGVFYMMWRWRYFGYFFPNTFYIKIDPRGSWDKLTGVAYVVSFLIELLLPYLLVAGLLLAVGLRRPGRNKLAGAVVRIGPTLLGCLLHCLYLLTIVPIQGFFWRYAFPIFPAFLYALTQVFERFRLERSMPRRALLRGLVVTFFVAWNLRFLPEASYNEAYRTQHDRVAIGRALAGTHGTMLTTAAGAIPYYSGWKAVDMMGLVSEQVAHSGVSEDLLRGLDPDLVVMRSPQPGKLVFRQHSHRTTKAYMLERGFLAVAAVHRSFRYHLFLFVRQDSPLFDDLSNRLRGIEDVTYGDLEVLMKGSGVPICCRETERDGRD